jgi:hypothetical protein
MTIASLLCSNTDRNRSPARTNSCSCSRNRSSRSARSRAPSVVAASIETSFLSNGSNSAGRSDPLAKPLSLQEVRLRHFGTAYHSPTQAPIERRRRAELHRWIGRPRTLLHPVETVAIRQIVRWSRPLFRPVPVHRRFGRSNRRV